jgi:hypothetical protein
MLRALAPRAGDKHGRQLVEAAKTLPGDTLDGDGQPISPLADALQAMAAHLEPEAARDAYEAAETIEDVSASTYTALALAPRLPHKQRMQAVRSLSALAATQTADTRASIIGSLVAAAEPDEVPGLVGQALDALRAAPPADENLHGQALFTLAPAMDAEQAAAAWSVARGFGNAHARGVLASSLIPRLSEEERDAAAHEALPDLRQVEPEEYRFNVVMQVIGAISIAARRPLVEEALTAASALGPAGFDMSAGAAAVPLAAEDAAAITIAALESALAMDGGAADAKQKQAAATLRAPFDDGLLDLDLDAPVATLRTLPNGLTGYSSSHKGAMIFFGDTIVEVIRDRADQLPAPARVAILESTLRALHADARPAWTDITGRLLTHLPAHDEEVLARIEAALGPRMDRAVTLEYLAPRLPTWFQARPSDVRAWREQEAATIMLHGLVTVLGALPRASLHRIWAEMLEFYSADQRPALLVPLRHLEPVAWALGGETAVTGVASAVRACEARWP